MIEFYDEEVFWDEAMVVFGCKVAEDTIKLLDLPVAVEVSLNVVSADEIRQINAEQREMDKVTDVLSFPMLDFPYPLAQETFDMEAATAINPESGNVFLGDIVLCHDRAVEQAAEYGHSLQREIAFLIVHSILHLLGYDHMTEQEEKEMFGKQEEILQLLGITR